MGYHADRRNAQISRSDKNKGRVSTLRPEGGSDDEVVWECAARARRSVHRWVAWAFGSSRAKRQSDQDRHEPGAHRRRRVAEQGDQHRARDLARRRQRQGRSARPAGRARHLRRPEHAGERAEHLHQADHRRQSRPAARALRHQLRRAGDADHHPEQEADDQLHRDRHQRQIPLRQDTSRWSRSDPRA